MVTFILSIIIKLQFKSVADQNSSHSLSSCFGILAEAGTTRFGAATGAAGGLLCPIVLTEGDFPFELTLKKLSNWVMLVDCSLIAILPAAAC
ncbi:MAG: hypothetical protein ACXW1U_21185, partial [Methylobacter sp.]